MKIHYFIISIFAFIIVTVEASACDILLSSDKDQYKVGDVIVVKMEVKWTHKTCIKEDVEPSLKLVGLELVAKTKFKEISPGIWDVKYKMKVTGKNASINAYEDCSKGGGSANLKIRVQE
jgi:hypothetical protein